MSFDELQILACNNLPKHCGIINQFHGFFVLFHPRTTGLALVSLGCACRHKGKKELQSSLHNQEFIVLQGYQSCMKLIDLEQDHGAHQDERCPFN